MSDDGPVLLRYHDPEGDDRRGSTEDVGIYRSRARAQAAADEHNVRCLAFYNTKHRQANDRERLRIAENNALVDAGLRETRFNVPHVDWVDIESVDDKRYRGQRYFVDEVEYDDD